MFLKIRGSEEGYWEYIFNVQELTVQDVELIDTNSSTSTMREMNEVLDKMDFDLCVIDSTLTSTGRYQRISCTVWEHPDKPRRKTVVFNTCAYLCQDNGRTAAAYVVNNAAISGN